MVKCKKCGRKVSYVYRDIPNQCPDCGDVFRKQELIHKGVTYYYYPEEDICFDDLTGQKLAYVQDLDGNAYTVVWDDDGEVSEIVSEDLL